MDIIIRQEQPGDYTAVYHLVKSAFEHAEYADGDEQDLVEHLRKGAAFIPELSLVAELDGKIVGHILFTKATVGATTQLTLAPLAIHPDYQKLGIGGKLIVQGHRIAKELGYEFSVLVGHAAYYPRFGYQPASQFGIRSPMELPEEVFMAINLLGKETMLNDVIRFAPEFGL